MMDESWLEEHVPVAPADAIAAGKTALASHGGNVWLALRAEPELRFEIVSAWLADAGDIETVKKRVRQLGEFIDAAGEAHN